MQHMAEMRTQMWIPIQSGQVFRREAGHDSEMMSATIPI
jgi:hypothetical protein